MFPSKLRPPLPTTPSLLPPFLPHTLRARPSSPVRNGSKRETVLSQSSERAPPHIQKLQHLPMKSRKSEKRLSKVSEPNFQVKTLASLFLPLRVRVPLCAAVLPHCSTCSLFSSPKARLHDGCKRGHKRRGSCRKSSEGTLKGAGTYPHPPPLPETAT